MGGSQGGRGSPQPRGSGLWLGKLVSGKFENKKKKAGLRPAWTMTRGLGPGPKAWAKAGLAWARAKALAEAWTKPQQGFGNGKGLGQNVDQGLGQGLDEALDMTKALAKTLARPGPWPASQPIQGLKV